MARLYRKGPSGVIADGEHAMTYYELACMQRNVQVVGCRTAGSHLAFMAEGDDLARALALYTRACTERGELWAYPEPTNLRKGYNGLYGLVTSGLGRDVLSGDLFLFVNRTSCKVLMWDGTGLCIEVALPAPSPRLDGATDRQGEEASRLAGRLRDLRTGLLHSARDLDRAHRRGLTVSSRSAAA